MSFSLLSQYREEKVTDEKQEALLDAVKVAAMKYGITEISTRNIGEIAQVNDAYIYRYFKNKEELLLKAYERENGAIFNTIIYEIDTVHDLKIDLMQKAKISFDRVWKAVLSDPERLNFCVSYYHSNHFESATDYHNSQIDELLKRLGGYFKSKDGCVQAMYSMCSILYDSAASIILGRAENTEEYAKRVFETEMAIFKANM